MQECGVRRDGDIERARSEGTSASPPASFPYASSVSPRACAGARTVRDLKHIAPLGCVVFSASTCTRSERAVVSRHQKRI